MIKFEVGKHYYFKGADLTCMDGECIDRNDLNGIGYVVFSFPEKGLFAKCFVSYELGDYTLGDSDDTETLYCTMKGKSYTSNSRWVTK